VEAAGTQLETCKLCGTIVNPDYRAAHDRVHQAAHEPFSVEAQGTEVDTCTLCGTIVNRYYREAHDRVHA
jgi:hypothetical protein